MNKRKSVFQIILALIFFWQIPAQAVQLIPDHDGINETNILSIARHPTNPNIYFAGTSAGLYKSEDGMKSWDLLNDNPLKTYEVFNVAINQANPAIMAAQVYSLDLSYPSDIDYSAYYASMDGGKHWNKMNAIRGNERIYHVVFCPIHRDEIIAATGVSLYSSTDLGLSWRELGVNQGKSRVNGIFISNNQAHSFYAIMGSALYKSNDHGVNWTRTQTNQQVDMFGSYISSESSDGSEFYINTFNGVYRFDTKQETLERVFTRKTNSLPSDLFLSINSNILYVISDDKLLTSTDHGKHWQQVTNTPFSLSLAMWRDQSDGFMVYTDHGLYHTDNKASTWQSVDSGFKNIAVNQMAYNDKTKTLYAGTGLNLWSKKNGDHWRDTPFFKGQSVTNVGITQDREGHQSLLVGVSDIYYPPDFMFKLYMSKDDGKTWQKVFDDGDDMHKFRINPVNPSQVFVIRNSSIMKSLDGGETWGEWQSWGDTLWAVVDISFNPYNAMEIEFVGLEFNGKHLIYKSIDGGMTWNILPPLEEYNWYYGYYFDKPVIGRTFLTSYLHPYLYETTNGGAVYTETGAKSLPEMYLQKFMIDPNNTSTFYAALEGGNHRTTGGIYTSKDSGATWNTLSEDDVTRVLTTALLTPEGRLYVGTKMGIYRLDLN